MLIEPTELLSKFGVKPGGILHVGAHKGEMFSKYNQVWSSKGIKFIWVEALPDLAEFLVNFLPSEMNKVINAVVWDKNDLIMDFNISSNLQSSSLLNFELHSQSYPEIKMIKTIKVKTKRLDGLIQPSDNIDLLVLDLQGAELNALIGLGVELGRVNWIVCEVNRSNVYEGNPLVEEIDNYLVNFGFKRIATRWTPNGWGDALYAKVNFIRGHRINIIAFKVKEFKLTSRIIGKIKQHVLKDHG